MPQTPRLLIGLGNPGKEYENTRHNAGFMVLDLIARRWGATWANERKLDGWVARHEGTVLLKPKTFMNLSGRSVQAAMRYFKIEAPEILVIYDDVALPVGKLRLRLLGSAGGHNGMRSIIGQLGTQEFARLRFGVGAVPPGWDMADYVLGRFEPEVRDELDKSLEKAADAAILAALRDLTVAMNQFNPAETPPPPPRPARNKPPVPPTPPTQSQDP